MAASSQDTNTQSLPRVTYLPSLRNELVLVIGIIASAIASGYIAFYFPETSQDIGSIFGITISLPIAGVVPLVFLGQLFHNLNNRKLVVYDDGVLFVQGLIAWKQHSVRMRYIHIREIEVNQTILQKLFNVGDIILISVASHESDDEINMIGISNPEGAKLLIQEKLAKAGSPATVVED